MGICWEWAGIKSAVFKTRNDILFPLVLQQDCHDSSFHEPQIVRSADSNRSPYLLIHPPGSPGHFSSSTDEKFDSEKTNSSNANFTMRRMGFQPFVDQDGWRTQKCRDWASQTTYWSQPMVVHQVMALGYIKKGINNAINASGLTQWMENTVWFIVQSVAFYGVKIPGRQRFTASLWFQSYTWHVKIELMLTLVSWIGGSPVSVSRDHLFRGAA